MADTNDDTSPGIRSGDILTTGDFAERARRTIDFDKGADVNVAPDEVPEHLRNLIPLVEKWAIVGSGPQLVFIEHIRINAPDELDAFLTAVKPALGDIRAWIRQSVETHGVRNTPDAVSHFSYFVSTYELAKPVDPDVLAKGLQKKAALKAAKAMQIAIEAANSAMYEKRYEDVVDFLEPYEAELTGSTLKKLEFARKRTHS